MILPRAAVNSRAVAAHYDDLDELYRSLWGTSVHHGYWITGKESADEAVANLTRLVARQASLNPDSAVEKSGGRNMGRYGVENWDGGNDFVGMVWSLVGNRAFQLRRNRKSV